VRAFRFSCNVFAIRSRSSFAAYCRGAEERGYDVVFAADHLGSPAPFPALVAAAEATQRLRVGTLVLNAGFWNPHLLAREVATVDTLTDGRLDLGLGAGHMKWEFDAAGIAWPSFPERVERLEEMLDELERVFTSGGYPEREPLREIYDLPVLAPVQRHGFNGSGPPLIIGGMSHAVLGIAARRAQIVAVGGLFQAQGKPPGTFRLATEEETAERVDFIREQAGARLADLELNMLVQAVVVTGDRFAVAEKLIAEHFQEYTPDQLLATPFVLIGTAKQIAERLREARQRFGFSFITVHEPYMEAFAPVIEELR
jgi:probable F420-dependent oxidoreductase